VTDKQTRHMNERS